MNNNDIMRRLRYALDLSDVKMVQIFKCSNYDIDALKIKDMLRKEDEEEFFELGQFLSKLFWQ